MSPRAEVISSSFDPKRLELVMVLSDGQEIRVSEAELANLTQDKGRATNSPYDPQYGELAARKYGAVSCDSCQHSEKESKWCAGCVKASLYSPRVLATSPDLRAQALNKLKQKLKEAGESND